MNFPTSSKSILIIKGLIKQHKCKLSCAGDSMIPLFRPGEIVNIEPLGHQMKIGDVVLYYTKEGFDYLLILHRIHYITKKYVVTKGDNNFAFDVPIEKNSILGMAVDCYNAQVDIVRAENFFNDYIRGKMNEKK